MFFQNFKFKFFVLIAIILLILSVLIYFFQFERIEYEKKKAVIKNQEFSVEVADDDKKRSLGLSGRDFLCEKCGMLFVFPREDFYGFWMKDMRFDLDILWLNKGKVVFIEKNVSYENQEKIYKPSVKSDSVLELNSGVVDKFEIELGDVVEIEN